jgi:hypothetical protein
MEYVQHDLVSVREKCLKSLHGGLVGGARRAGLAHVTQEIRM